MQWQRKRSGHYRLSINSCFMFYHRAHRRSLVYANNNNNDVITWSWANGVHFQIRICCTCAPHSLTRSMELESVVWARVWYVNSAKYDDTSHLRSIVASGHVSLDSGRTANGTESNCMHKTRLDTLLLWMHSVILCVLPYMIFRWHLPGCVCL